MLLAGYGLEWARAGWVLIDARLAHDMSIMPAAPIMAAVTLFTFACIPILTIALGHSCRKASA